MAKKTSSTYLDKIENEIQSNQSKVSLVLGALIVLVIGILVFNYFNRNKPGLGPAQQTQQEPSQDVSQDQLPGPYTVKSGDTLFMIADKYYQNGYQYTEIAKANNITNPDLIEEGQVLQIPKPEPQQTPLALQPSPSSLSSEEPTTATGGGNTTIWGPRIEENTYTVTEGDWLSKIAGRAYGDILAFNRIAQANNITNPDYIEPGMVLKIPR